MSMEINIKVDEEEVMRKTVGISEYARWFNIECIGWGPSPEWNLVYLKNQHKFMNEVLRAKGHVFLNEVYDNLGMPRTIAGQVVGWVYDDGNGFIDFGIFNNCNKNFVNGLSKDCLLDFNVDGVILDKI